MIREAQEGRYPAGVVEQDAAGRTVLAPRIQPGDYVMVWNTITKGAGWARLYQGAKTTSGTVLQHATVTIQTQKDRWTYSLGFTPIHERPISRDASRPMAGATAAVPSTQGASPAAAARPPPANTKRSPEGPQPAPKRSRTGLQALKEQMDDAKKAAKTALALYEGRVISPDWTLHDKLAYGISRPNATVLALVGVGRLTPSAHMALKELVQSTSPGHVVEKNTHKNGHDVFAIMDPTSLVYCGWSATSSRTHNCASWASTVFSSVARCAGVLGLFLPSSCRAVDPSFPCPER